MTTEEKLAAKTLAYDALKIMFNMTVMIFTFVLLIMVWYLHESKTALELNTERYNEMRKAYDIQAIYYNNMKARFEAINPQEKENE